ncbi:MAG TPA: tetratricopeptide repeat protein [Verrucomicrobiota bacterium]|nr:tetratricopeptide repeat protein [Verrucomicrobiota bacterium]HNT15752.1 tetratricopeptide repeat protein [Verrucomicrobiota bacterium]
MRPSTHTTLMSSPTLRRIGAGVSLGWLALALISCGKSPDPRSAPEAQPPVNPAEIKTRADAGDAEAQLKYAQICANGEGVKRDYKLAAEYYRKAAEQGNAAAQTSLGQLYEAGRGVPGDPKEAAEWTLKAAEQGYARGQYALAVYYMTGTGVTKSDADALKWYRASANGGYAYAQFHLGMRYKDGQGVTANPVEAYKWLSLAADGGVAEAPEIRQEVQGRMTSAQVNEAKRQVKEFTAKPTIPPH